jgi:hypothetical protein
LGSTEVDLFQTDFFSFFHLRVSGQPVQQGCYTVRNYGTTGAFKAFLQVKVTYDPQGKAVRMQQFVAREFIDSEETRPFANDVMKSFVRDATPKSDRAATSGLIDEIQYYNIAKNRAIIMHNGATQGKEKLIRGEVEPSAGYKVVLGKSPNFTQKNRGSCLTLAAVEIDGNRWVELTLTARQPGPTTRRASPWVD